MLRQHAEDLNSGPLSKLSLLIRERQQLRKTYSEQWQQLQQELTKVSGQQWGFSQFYLNFEPPRGCFAQEALDSLGKWKSLTAGLACSNLDAASSLPPLCWAGLQQGLSVLFLCLGKVLGMLRMSDLSFAWEKLRISTHLHTVPSNSGF